jgi:hypothetical protein
MVSQYDVFLTCGSLWTYVQVLAKQNQYAEAHRVKMQADKVEEWEMCQQTKLV